MAWVIVKDGAVVREFSRPTAFTYEGYQYPANWIQNATNTEKSAIGLVEVTISGNIKNKVSNKFSQIEDLRGFDFEIIDQEVKKKLMQLLP